MTDVSIKGIVQEQQWDREVKAKGNLLDLRLKDVWKYRDLIMLFVWRDFVSQYKQTILGPAWQVIQPALTTGIFMILFNRIARIPTDGISPVVFYMAGITVWNYFSSNVLVISSTFVKNAYIFGKVYFPRLVIPISFVISNLIKFGLQFLLLVGVMIYYHFNGYPVHLSINLLFIPLLLVQLAALALGLGIIISSVTTKYRDFSVLLSFAIQLMMYVTPVVYPLSYVKDRSYKWLIELNPVTPIVEAFRLALFNKGTVTLTGELYSIGFTFIALLAGIVLFNKVEKTFIDTV
ncbi:MAG: ABC transporter permease [Ferruginibacter sp.]